MTSLGIKYLGKKRTRRYVISRNDDELWTGAAWSECLDDALFYRRLREMQKEFRRLQLEEVSGWPVRTFVVPLVVRVAAWNSFTRSELIRYFRRAMTIMIDGKKGQGPCEDSVTMIDLTFCRLKEVTGKPRCER